MNGPEFVAALMDALRSSETVSTEIGVFFTQVFEGYVGRNPMTGQAVPVPAKRAPYFVPSDRLLERIGAKDSFCSSEYRRYLAQDFWGDVDLTLGEPAYGDPNDYKEPILVPDPSCSIAAGDVLDEVVSAIGARRQFKLSGFGSLKLTKVARGPMKGRVVLVFRPSQVLKGALNDR